MTASPNKKSATILAVDDTPANLIALEAVLGSDYHFLATHSGHEAIALLETRQDIDVILMDLQMPDMDGFQATERIKAIPHCKDTPVIFITAVYREEPFVKKGYSVGAVDYFSKPFDPEILKMKVGIYASFRQKANVLMERERQVRESEELLKVGRKLSSLLETLPVGVIIADTAGRICQTNAEVSRIWKTDGPIDQDSYGVILGWWDSGGEMLPTHDGPLARALEEGETTHSEVVQIQCLDKTEKSILVSASPLRAIDRHIVGAVVVIQDVTEPKRIEKALEERVTRLVNIGIELESSPVFTSVQNASRS